MKRIIGENLIAEASAFEDQQHNTDLIVLHLGAVRVACRVRRHHYLSKYGDEFTIRTDRTSGAKTELSKLIEGFGDYFLYGFSDESETYLCQWFLGDLKAFRLWLFRYMATNHGKMPGFKGKNVDHKASTFYAFKVAEVNGFVKARHP